MSYAQAIQVRNVAEAPERPRFRETSNASRSERQAVRVERSSSRKARSPAGAVTFTVTKRRQHSLTL